jgi:hypothetical protein
LGTKDYLTYKINSISFSSTAVFNDKRVYARNESVYMNYSVSGAGFDKTSFLKVYNEEGVELTHLSQNRITSQDLGTIEFKVPTNLLHGKYRLECYS